jgi:hypothetical protein
MRFLGGLCLASLLSVQLMVCRAAEPSKSLQLSPIAFETNLGQSPQKYSFLFHRDGLRAMFLENGADLALCGMSGCDEKLALTFVGAHSVPEPTSALTGRVNYFLGNDSARWIRNIPLSSVIEYKELYPGISLSFYGNGEELEHDFRIAPGSDPSRIAFRFDGATRIDLTSDGGLEIHTANSALTLKKPVAWQQADTVHTPVDAGFVQNSDGSIRFRVGAYDRKFPLVIDPVIVFSSYLGGTGTDLATAITTDASGDVLVTGSTTSTDFPTGNALQSSLGTNGQSVFVTKFDPTGKTLIYSTYLGGSSQALGAASATGGAIAVDANGNAIVAGLTSSGNFPVAGAGTTLSCQTNDDCFFLASLAPDGSKLNYAGTVGGEQGFYTLGTGVNLAVDGSGNAYLAGTTDNSNFQITVGTLATSVIGYPYNETFVLKVDPTGKLLYSTVIPGNDTSSTDLLQPYTNDFIPTGIAVDTSGDVTIAGTTGLGLPTTSGVVGQQFPNAYVNVGNQSAGFVLQINPSASAINFASYLPGTDYNGGLTVGTTGNLYLTGGTGETNLPASANAYQKTITPNSDGQYEAGYIMELNPTATSIMEATYLGAGTVGGYGYSGLALDSQGDVFVGGYATSQGFPLQNPFVTGYEYTETIADLVLAEMSPDLSTLEFGSFLSATDGVYAGSKFAGLAVDNSNNLVVAGTTLSLDFPTTSGSFEPKLPPPANPNVGLQHSFVAKFNMSTPAPAVCFSSFGVSFGSVNANSSDSQTLNVTNCGNASLDISSIASSDPTVTASGICTSISPGSVCPIILTFTPVSSKATSGTITLTDNAQTIPQTVSFTGQGIAPEIVANANPLSFGHVLVGAPAVNGVLLVSNGGQAALSVGTVTVSGAGYSLVNNGCTQVLPANSYMACPIGIAFAPANSGTQTGTVVIASNDPATPQITVALTGVGDAVYAVPSISSISAPTVLINNGAVNLSISGANFYPQSVAQLNGVALSTTFENNSTLQAIIPAPSLTAIGEQQLVVVNPAPGGGASPSIAVTPYQTLVISPSALVSVSATGMLYAAIPASATNNPNTVIPIDPATGAEGTPIPVGNNPQFLVASSDGAYLYVANTVDETVQRINLATNSVERTFPYTPNIYCPSCEILNATDLEIVPGSPQEVLLAQGSILSLFNDAGLVNYVPSTGACCYADPDFASIALAGNPLAIYGLPFSFGGGFFQTVTLSSSGLQYTRPSGYTGGLNNTTGAQVISDGTLLYTSAGQVWNPATQTEVGTFPLQTVNETTYPNNWNITLDTALGQIYGVGDQMTGNSDYVVISAFGMKSYALTGSLAFPQIYYPYEIHLVRWGTNGLAFIGPGVGLTDQEVYILSSSIVSAQSANTTPTLASILPASANAAGPSFTLTVNGSGFLPGSVIEWNQTPLTTTYVSSQQLTAAVPASDLATPGIAQVAVFNPAPGGGSSEAALFTISSAATSTALTITPAGGTLPANSAYTLSAAVTTGSGTAVTTGNVVFTIGSGTQTVALNASGTATLSGTAPGSVGSLTISAAYQGSTDFSPSESSTLNETLADIGTSTTLAASPTQILSGAQVTLTATVTPSSGTTVPSGSVSFYNGSSLLQSANLSNGVASIATTSLPGGADTVSATYAGAGFFSSSTSNSVTINVSVPNPAPILTSFSPAFVSAGSAGFTLTVNGSGFISGSTVYWGSTALSTQVVNASQLTAQVQAAQISSAGITAITIVSPAPGGGTSNAEQFEVDYAGSGSGPVFGTTSVSIAPGATASYLVTLPASATDVSVTCLNLPSGATCNYSSTTGTLTITTSSSTPAGAYVITTVFTETLPAAATALLLLPFLLRSRIRSRRKLRFARAWFLASAGILILVALAGNGCSGGNGGGGSATPTTHQVTSSGSVTLTVQ